MTEWFLWPVTSSPYTAAAATWVTMAVGFVSMLHGALQVIDWAVTRWGRR